MKIKKVEKGPDRIKFGNKSADTPALLAEWWKAKTDDQLATQLCGTATYLKQNQAYRLRQLATSVRLYCGLNVYQYAGSNVSKMDKTRTLPDDRPTFNLISSITDTLVSRISQNEPQPKFLTDNADYKQRHLAQQLNQFVLGEFYQTKAYQKGKMMFRDGTIMGSGCLKVYEGYDNKVAVDRVLVTDLYVDENDSINGEPQNLIQLKLMDRDKLIAQNPDAEFLSATPNSYPDNAPDAGRTIADQILVVEAWHLPIGEDPEEPGFIPGRHVIACANGVILDESWIKPKFPFVFFNYSDPFLGFWGQGVATRQFGTQLSLNRILYTIAKSIQLVGVPRVFVNQHSKVVKSHNNNEIGVIITYTGEKPSYEVAPCNAPELYQERDKLIEYGFRSEGVSDMQATGEKPKGLSSGEAIRSYDDVNSDRFSLLQKKYEQLYIELAYQITDCAMEIAKREGKYQTVYPNKDGTKEIDLPKMSILKDPFVIQCFSESALPRTPAGRIATVTEQVQAGMLTIKEGRRLMKFPDLEQNEKLDNASEERIFKILDAIVEDGKYTPPDQFLDFDLATTLVVQYINLYRAANLPQERDDMLEKFFIQVQQFKQMAMPPPMPAGAPATPQANPEALPTSPLVPNAVQPAA